MYICLPYQDLPRGVQDASRYVLEGRAVQSNHRVNWLRSWYMECLGSVLPQMAVNSVTVDVVSLDTKRTLKFVTIRRRSQKETT